MGKEIVARYDLDNLRVGKPDQWDGLWRIFIFDIPADKRGRHYLIMKLKELGFIMIQKSVWAHPFECREQLAVICKAFEIEPYVLSFIASDMDDDKRIRQNFEKLNGIKLV